MKNNIRSHVVGFASALLVAMPLAGTADVVVQNAQYKSEKSALYVKGKLTGDGVVKVYIVDVDRRQQIGFIETYSRGQQFRADVPISSPDRVPCVIRVQTMPSFGGFGLFAAFGPPTGESTVTTVREAPERCTAQ